VPVGVTSHFDNWRRYLQLLQEGAFEYLYLLKFDEIARHMQNASSLDRQESSKPVALAAPWNFLSG
jgi:hypothetical protein